jgi:hypothetical protein
MWFRNARGSSHAAAPHSKKIIPLGRGKGRQALGWVIAGGQRSPLRRSATAVAPRAPSLRATPPKEGIFKGDQCPHHLERFA